MGTSEAVDFEQQYRFKVLYYNRQKSHRGAGSQVRYFQDEADATAFAGQNRIYAGPCRVELTDSEKATRPVSSEPARSKPC